MRPDKYDVSQFSDVLVMPMEARRSRRILCEIVSKAEVKSRRMSMVRRPESAAISRLLVTLIKAVSVLWKGRKPD